MAQPGTSRGDPAELAALLIGNRVGGSFWGPQPAIDHGTVLLAPASAAQLQEMLRKGPPASAIICAPRKWAVPAVQRRIDPGSDPWWLAARCGEIWASGDSELALVGALAGKTVQVFSEGAFAGSDADPQAVLAQVCDNSAYVDPFSGQAWTAFEAARQLADWRVQIDSNRKIAAIYGVARWKRETLDALLWDGTGPVRHAAAPLVQLPPGQQVAAWKSRTAGSVLAKLGTSGISIGEIEDGFIRSAGLGANCVPPLSAIVDFSGVYFDPSGPSDLERIIENADISAALCARAATLRTHLVEAGVTKYGREAPVASARNGGTRRILVTGQVEDDRSVLSGGGDTSNLGIIVQARMLEPDAWIIYKPHPDVEAGHRKGHVPDSEALRFADEVSRDQSITSLIASVDAVHVITSLAGFEALLRGKAVTAHGTPFYAGWGLTTDLGPVPARRTRRRSLNELVAATLLLYPRYIDPVSRLPCTAEVVVQRMAAGEASVTSPLVHLREYLGRARNAVRTIGSRGPVVTQ